MASNPVDYNSHWHVTDPEMVTRQYIANTTRIVLFLFVSKFYGPFNPVGHVERGQFT